MIVMMLDPQKDYDSNDDVMLCLIIHQMMIAISSYGKVRGILRIFKYSSRIVNSLHLTMITF